MSEPCQKLILHWPGPWEVHYHASGAYACLAYMKCEQLAVQRDGRSYRGGCTCGVCCAKVS